MTGQWMRSPDPSFNGFYNMTADCPSYASQGDCANPGHWAAAGVPALFSLASHILHCMALHCFIQLFGTDQVMSLCTLYAKHHYMNCSFWRRCQVCHSRIHQRTVQPGF